MLFLEEELKRDKKFLILDHAYAGARRKNGVNANLWHTQQGIDYQDWYFDLFEKNKSKIVLEVAGHDHFEDLRTNYDKDGTPFRNLFIATGITPNKSNLPGFNTF